MRSDVAKVARAVRHGRQAVAGVVAAVLVTFVALPGPAVAGDYDDRRDAERRVAAAERRAQELQDSVEGLGADLGQAVLALQATQSRLPAAQAELAAAQETFDRSQRESTLIASRLEGARAQEASIEGTIAADRVREQDIRAAVGQLARDTIKGETEATGLSVALGATSIDEFIDKYAAVTTALRAQTKALDGLRQLDATNRNAQARLAAVGEEITGLKAEADQKVVTADAARDAAQARATEIEQLISAQAAQQQTLAGMKAQAEAEQAATEAESAAMAAELANIIAKQRAAARAARDAAAATAAAAGRKAPPPVQAPSGVVKGALFGNPTATNPIYVTSEYGMRLQPVLKIFRLHAGIDLRAPCDTAIYAGRAGTVLTTRPRGGNGNQVLIDHGFVDGNSVMTAYNHLSRYAVAPGEKVAQGQVVGYSGSTGGVSTGCHLDFQVFINGSTVNPRPYLGL
jgi:murein DD-endopeptidase MepM/ murein hydrolase activator NlpD